MWTLLEDEHEIRKAQRRLEAALTTAVTKSVACWGGYQGGKMKIRTNWCDRLGIWFATKLLADSPVPRHWNGFGTTEPSPDQLMNITCEMNSPLKGIDARAQGAFARDDRGDLHLVHRGRIGGGRKGIGKANFFLHFRGDKLTVLDGSEETEVALVADFDSPRFKVHVAEFVREIEVIKNLVTGKAEADEKAAVNSSTLEESFRNEPASRRGYEVYGWRQPSADHGLVVKALEKKLRDLGYWTRRDLRDLFIVRPDGSIQCLFEVKTGNDRADVYEAVGQLLFYSVDEARPPILTIVSPALSKEVARRVERLRLRHVAYRFKHTNIEFLGLDRSLTVK